MLCKQARAHTHTHTHTHSLSLFSSIFTRQTKWSAACACIGSMIRKYAHTCTSTWILTTNRKDRLYFAHVLAIQNPTLTDIHMCTLFADRNYREQFAHIPECASLVEREKYPVYIYIFLPTGMSIPIYFAHIFYSWTHAYVHMIMLSNPCRHAYRHVSAHVLARIFYIRSTFMCIWAQKVLSWLRQKNIPFREKYFHSGKENISLTEIILQNDGF